jgi:hypothetical protein
VKLPSARITLLEPVASVNVILMYESTGTVKLINELP